MQLKNGLRLKFLSNEQFGVRSKTKNTLLAVQIENPTDSSIRLTQTRFHIKTKNGKEIGILNPKLSVKHNKANNKISARYYLKEFRILIDQVETNSDEFPYLVSNRNDLEGTMVVGAVNTAISNVHKNQIDRYFKSEIFGKEIQKLSTVYGFLVIDVKVEEPLEFAIEK
ncbi:MAG: hypothetical protein ACKOE6_04080 [Flammeovirgaceae bacterium]